MKPQPTPSQTIGPFFGPAMARGETPSLARDGTRGERVIIEGRVLDGDGAGIPDALVEIWQANAEGRYNHPEDTQEKLLDRNFMGFGRVSTDTGGRFRFETIKPGPVPGNGGALQAPHINVSIFARGLLNRLVTRIYFPDEPLNNTDPVLKLVAPERRPTLIARAADGNRLRFDIVLQGGDETVFLDI